MCRFELTAEKEGDSDPKADIEEIMKHIANQDGDVLLPEFGKHVIQITPEEEHLYDRIDYDFDSLR